MSFPIPNYDTKPLPPEETLRERLWKWIKRRCGMGS